MADGGFALEALTYGQLNNLQENDSNASGDRRRTDPVTALRRAVEQAFSRDTLQGISEFYGIVVGRRTMTTAIYDYRPTVLNSFPTVQQQATESEEEPTLEDTAINQFLYKVYIPELQPLCPPVSFSDPIIFNYPDVGVDLPLGGKSDIALGSFVTVRYEDPGNLFGPKIVKVSDEILKITNLSSNISGKIQFKNGVVLPIHSAVPQRKLASKEIKKIAAQRPDFSGPTPNAEKLRAKLTELGYKEKGNEISNNGDIKESMANVGIEVLQKIKDKVPSVTIIVTGGNDKYHQVIKDAGMYTSIHTEGLALDFQFYKVNESNKSAILKVLQGFSAVNEPFRFLDEYKDLSPSASGPHFDISYKISDQGVNAQKKAKELLEKGEIEGYSLGDAS